MSLMTVMTIATVRTIQTGCAACGGALRGLRLGCQRCGASFHDGCYMTRIATPAEVVALMTTEEDVTVVCRGCRS